MKSSLPLIIGVGSVATLVLLSSGKASTSSSQKKTNSPPKSVGGIESGSSQSTTIGKSVPKRLICNKETEYYDAQTGKCVKFWTPTITDKKVEQKIKDLLWVLNNFNITDVCVIPELVMMNQNALGVIKETINNIWNVPLEQLPPTEDKKSPEWLMIVWDKVAKIYSNIACKNK